MKDVASRIRDAGDSALLLELEPVIDAEVNARAIAIAHAVREARLPGVRDVVSTYRSVAVFFDPLTVERASVAGVLEEQGTASPVLSPSRTIEVPVEYGGAHGPDLASVAMRAGVSEREVVDRHARPSYRVFMLGFLPGFAYMGRVDTSIAAPRHAEPRLRVPAGSVAIAGQQTGIYPRESPGGWQLIGWTPTAVFDPRRTPASLFAPGDSVRFVPTQSGAASPACPAVPEAAAEDAPTRPERQLTIVRPGLLTTVQDLGRWGHQSFGVPVAGPMDAASHRLANMLVGNAEEAATLEATVLGPELRLDAGATIAIAGADLGATVDGTPLPLNRARHCRGGSVVRFNGRRRGARASIACDGGFDTPRALGSRATHVLSGLGGVAGRALRAGDRLALGAATAPSHAVRSLDVPAAPDGGARLRVLPGPQDDFFHPHAIDILQRTRFTITPQSDRMGYRLAGPARIARLAREMISDVAVIGGVQVPASGDPILLMADRQTSGGYPQIATVITADVPLAGQLAPGDWVEFQVCTRAEAIDALRAQEASLRARA